MLMMFPLSAEAALLAHLARLARPPRAPAETDADGSAAAVADGSAAAVASEPAEDSSRRAAPASASEPCHEPSAIHDLAALQAGRLDPIRRRQLAQHMVQCDACRVLLATLLVEARRIEGTGTLPPAPLPGSSKK